MKIAAEDTRAYRLLMIRDFLKEAAAGRDVGSNISEALYLVDHFGPAVISAAEADELRFPAVNASIQACDVFPAWVPRAQIRKGFHALLAWIEQARLPFDQRDESSLEIRQRMRLLRNHAHNISIMGDLSDAASERTGPVREVPSAHAKPDPGASGLETSNSAIEIVAGYLWAAIVRQDAELNVVKAMRTFLSLRSEIAHASIPEFQRLEELVDIAKSVVAEVVAPQMEPAAVYFGFAAMKGLIRNFAPSFVFCEAPSLVAARLDHLALAANEIEAVILRRRIEAGGDQMRRLVIINRARAATTPAGMMN